MRLKHFESMTCSMRVRNRILTWLSPLLALAMLAHPCAAEEHSRAMLQEEFAKLKSRYVTIVWPTEPNSNMEIHVFPEGQQKQMREVLQEYGKRHVKQQELRQEYQKLLKQMVGKMDLKSLLSGTYKKMQELRKSPDRLYSEHDRIKISTGSFSSTAADLDLLLADVQTAMDNPESTPARILLNEFVSYSAPVNDPNGGLPVAHFIDPSVRGRSIYFRLWDPTLSTLPEKFATRQVIELSKFAQQAMEWDGARIQPELKAQLGETLQHAHALLEEYAQPEEKIQQYAAKSPQNHRYHFYLIKQVHGDFLELVPAIENGQREIIPMNRITRVVFLPETINGL